MHDSRCALRVVHRVAHVCWVTLHVGMCWSRSWAHCVDYVALRSATLRRRNWVHDRGWHREHSLCLCFLVALAVVHAGDLSDLLDDHVCLRVVHFVLGEAHFSNERVVLELYRPLVLLDPVLGHAQLGDLGLRLEFSAALRSRDLVARHCYCRKVVLVVEVDSRGALFHLVLAQAQVGGIGLLVQRLLVVRLAHLVLRHREGSNVRVVL